MLACVYQSASTSSSSSANSTPKLNMVTTAPLPPGLLVTSNFFRTPQNNNRNQNRSKTNFNRINNKNTRFIAKINENNDVICEPPVSMSSFFRNSINCDKVIIEQPRITYVPLINNRDDLCCHSDDNNNNKYYNIKSDNCNLLNNINNNDQTDNTSVITITSSDVCDQVKKRIPSSGDISSNQLPEGVELTLSELEQMACRQQAQIDSQRQLLAAKEQRLRFLKQHEARHQQVAAEHERLRRLRDRVEAQELKLRKLRALRGQVHQNKLNNASLTSDLDSIRALFNEKEKELSLAVAKVEELTRQLEDLRRGRGNATARETVQPAAAAQELEKLRRELMYRNKLNEQQNARLSQQREALSQRQEEMVSIDKRIAELQDRLHRKRLLNQQLASQINHQQHLRSTVSHHQQQHGTSPGTRGNIAAVEPYHHVPSSKPAMDHMPVLPARHNIYQMKPVSEQNQNRRLQNSNAPSDPSLIHEQGMHDDFTVLKMRKNSLSSSASQSVLPSAMLYTSANVQNNYQHDNIINSENNNLKIKDDNKLSNTINSNLTSDAIMGTTVTSTTTAMSSTTTDVIPEFGASKLDPKYQTLPYNTKFTINYLSSQPMTSSSSTGVNKNVNSVNSNSSNINNLIGRRPSGEGGENVIDNIGDEMKNVTLNSQQQQSQQVMNVVYSIPIPSGINKGLATGLANEIRPTSVSSVATSSVSSLSNSPSPSSSAITGSTITTRMGLLMSRGQPVGGTSSTTSSTSSLATNSSAGSSSANHQTAVSVVASSGVHCLPPSTSTALTSSTNLSSASSANNNYPISFSVSSIPSSVTVSLPPTLISSFYSSSLIAPSLSVSSSLSSNVNNKTSIFELPPTPLTYEFGQKPVSSVAPTSVHQQQLYNQSQSHSSIPVPNKLLSSTISSASLSQPSSQSCTAQVQDLTASPIYQTSSTKIHPVQPQILTSASHGILRDQKGECSSSSPQGSCSPLSSPDSPGTPKPALPPKPAVPIKPTPPPPPRQITHWPPESTTGSDKSISNPGEGVITSDSKKLVWPPPAVDISADAVDTALNVLRGAVNLSTRGGLSTQDIQSNKPNQPYQTVESETSNTMGSGTLSQLISNEPNVPPPPPTSEPPIEETPPPRRPTDQQIIKARPLTIRKQPLNEMPRLRNGSSFGNTTSGMISSSTLQDNNNDGINNYNNHRLSSNESGSSGSESNETMSTTNVQFSMSRRIEMPPAFLFPENEAPPADLIPAISNDLSDQSNNNNSTSVSSVDDNTEENNKLNDNNSNNNNNINNNNNNSDTINKSDESGSSDIETKNNINKEQQSGGDSVIVRRIKKGNLKGSKQLSGGQVMSRRVSFDPLALLLDASLEGELELVIRTAGQVRDPSAANDEGITALHNAICAGHLDIVTFLVQFGCDVNAQDSDGWTPLHCAASCNNLPMVRFLVEHGACIFATTLSDHETAAEKCEEDEEGFDGCSEYLYSVQEKLGILNNGAVYAVFSYEAHNSDELSFNEGDRLVVLRKGDEWEREWWWARLNDQEGYIPRNLLGLYPRVHPNKMPE